MLVKITKKNASIASLSEKLKKLGCEIGVNIQLQHEEVFNAMHRVWYDKNKRNFRNRKYDRKGTLRYSHRNYGVSLFGCIRVTAKATAIAIYDLICEKGKNLVKVADELSLEYGGPS